jgi:hypothetical protein
LHKETHRLCVYVRGHAEGGRRGAQQKRRERKDVRSGDSRHACSCSTEPNPGEALRHSGMLLPTFSLLTQISKTLNPKLFSARLMHRPQLLCTLSATQTFGADLYAFRMMHSCTHIRARHTRQCTCIPHARLAMLSQSAWIFSCGLRKSAQRGCAAVAHHATVHRKAPAPAPVHDHTHHSSKFPFLPSFFNRRSTYNIVKYFFHTQKK